MEASGKRHIIHISIITICFIFIVAGYQFVKSQNLYNSAIKKIENNSYVDAFETYLELKNSNNVKYCANLNNLVIRRIDKEIDPLINQKKFAEAILILNRMTNEFESVNEYCNNKVEELTKIKNVEMAYQNAINSYNEKKFIDAFYQYRKILNEPKYSEEATKRTIEISEKLFPQYLLLSQKALSKKNYTEAFKYINTTLDLKPNDEKAKGLLAKYKDEQGKIAEIEAIKLAEEEASRYEPKKIVDKDGKQIWKIFIANGSIHFTGTYRGSGNFIVKLSNSNQDLLEVIANEIGDFVSDKTVAVPYEGWYYLEIYGSDGSWEYEWN